MHKRESGWASLVILIVVTLLLLGLAGYFVWSAQDSKSDSIDESNSSADADSSSQTKKAVDKSEDTPEAITEVSVTLQVVGDEETLPAVTPESFVDYMKTRLEDFDCDFDEFPNGGFNVTKISPRFVAGGIGCEGGASTVWYLTGVGWDELGFQSVVPCSALVERAIPSEFIAECYDDTNPELVIANPNGPLISSDTN